MQKMESQPLIYDERYLAGVLLFNRGDFFEAHEVWEDLWMETSGPEKQFYQGLIQAAVGLCHFCNGNLRGAKKLFHSSREYMAKYATHHNGLDQTVFWNDMTKCFKALIETDELDQPIEVEEELIPEIELDPPPERWPDPDEILESSE